MSTNVNSGGGKWKCRRKRSKNGTQKSPSGTADHSQARGQSIDSVHQAAGKRAKYEDANNATTNSPIVNGSATESCSAATASGTPMQERDEKQVVQQQSSDSGEGKRNKRRRRRGHRRRWKPYYKLTNEERRLLEIREEKHAERIRAQRFKHGLPVAPYNTTQFLLNDRQQRGNNDEPSNVDEIVASIGRHHHYRSESYESGSDSCAASRSSLSDSSDYSLMEKEFDNEYESAYAERLESMSKSDLIKDYVEMEKQFEKSQRELSAKNREIIELRQRLSVFEDEENRRRFIPIDVAGDEEQPVHTLDDTETT